MGLTSICHRVSPFRPVSRPGTSLLLSGTCVDNTVCALCTSATWFSSARTPCALVDINCPMAMIDTATSASATSTSMMVKPASRRSIEARSVGKRCTGVHLYPAGQPVDADLIGHIETAERDRTAARHAVRKEADDRQRCALAAALRQQRIEAHVVRNS